MERDFFRSRVSTVQSEISLVYISWNLISYFRAFSSFYRSFYLFPISLLTRYQANISNFKFLFGSQVLFLFFFLFFFLIFFFFFFFFFFLFSYQNQHPTITFLAGYFRRTSVKLCLENIERSHMHEKGREFPGSIFLQ